MSAPEAKPPLADKTVAELKSMIANADQILAGPNTKMHGPAAAFREAARLALAGRRVGFAAAAPDLVLASAAKRQARAAAPSWRVEAPPAAKVLAWWQEA